MTIDVLTIFPSLVEVALSEGVVARARESGKLEIRARDLRDFTDDKHRSVDDVPAALVEIARPGDLILTMGAGSIGTAAARVVAAIEQRPGGGTT